MVDLVRGGRDPDDLAREFEPTGHSIRAWVAQANRNEGRRLGRRRFASQAEARMACFSYIEGWYNPARLHSGLGYRSPVTYEADMQATMTDT
jgi:transposase InsO family protein